MNTSTAPVTVNNSSTRKTARNSGVGGSGSSVGRTVACIVGVGEGEGVGAAVGLDVAVEVGVGVGLGVTFGVGVATSATVKYTLSDS